MSTQTILRANAKYLNFQELLDCPYNRTVDVAKVAAIQAAIELEGDVKPFVVVEVRTDSGVKFMITDGHHRALAIRSLIAAGKLAADVRVPYVISGEEGVNSAKKETAARLTNSTGAGSKQLAPIIDRENYHIPIAKNIEWVIWKNIFSELMEILRPGRPVLENAKSALKRALETGRVQYVDGYIVGGLNNQISSNIHSLGGTFSKQKKGWKISLSQMPQDVRAAVAAGQDRMDHLKKKLEAQMKVLETKRVRIEPLATLDIDRQFGAVVDDLDKQYGKTVAAQLEIPMETNAHMRQELAAGYTENLDLYIKDWEEQAIFRLRNVVEKNVQQGFRAETLERSIMSEWGVSQRKAKFLARQETSLLVSKFREERYADAGIQTYRWSTSHDERVRTDHKDLSGKVFNFSNPPITDRVTGATNNPGEDFNCRCIAIPIIGRAA